MSDTLQYSIPPHPRPRSPVIAVAVEKLAQGKPYFDISVSKGGII
jgi:hypothetical protein